MKNVLIIGSRPAEGFARTLEREGFQVALRPPGEAAEEDISTANLVVLMMSEIGEDATAKDFLEGAHSGESPPVVIVIPRAELARFDPKTDVDDFFVEDGDPAEFAARVRLVLWKRHQVDTRDVLKAGNLVMDLANYTVHINGKPVDLTYKEYELLRFLATNPDRVFGRDQLLNKVWGYDFYGGARTVDVHIRRLRAKIEDKNNTFIETVRNVGYRFRALP